MSARRPRAATPSASNARTGPRPALYESEGHSKEPAGQRLLTDPEVQQTIRDGLRNRKEQLLRAAYLTEAREQAHITNYLAREIIESSGKLPASK